MAVRVRGCLTEPLFRQPVQHVLGHREHTACLAGVFVKQAGPELIRPTLGRRTSFAISMRASCGVKCSPAFSLFSSLKRRTRFLEDRAPAVGVETGVRRRAVGTLVRDPFGVRCGLHVEDWLLRALQGRVSR